MVFGVTARIVIDGRFVTIPVRDRGQASIFIIKVIKLSASKGVERA
jgi:hypothetical protein